MNCFTPARLGVTALVVVCLTTPLARALPYLPAVPKGSIAVNLQPIATGMAAPDYAISPPGDINRLFVVEQNGLLRIIQNGSLAAGCRARPADAACSRRLNPANANDERGFLGLAFHPGFDNADSPGYRTLYTYTSEPIPAGTSPTYPCAEQRHAELQDGDLRVEDVGRGSQRDRSQLAPRDLFRSARTPAITTAARSRLGHDGYLYLATRRRRQRERRGRQPHRAGRQRAEPHDAARERCCASIRSTRR